MSMQPIRCTTYEEFDLICNDLNRIGNKDHEKFSVEQVNEKDRQGYKPITSKGIWGGTFFHNAERTKSLSNFLVSFFTENKDFLGKQEETLRRIKKVIGKTDPDIKKSFASLIRTSILQESELTHMQEIRNIFEAQEVQEASRLQGICAIDEKMQQLENSLSRIESLIADRQVSLCDTLLLCAGEEKIFTYFTLLQKVPYFTTFIASDDKQLNIIKKHENGFPRLAFAFDLSDYSIKTVQKFLCYLTDNKNLIETQDFDEFMRLYALTDFLGVENVCCQYKYSDAELLHILVHSEYSPSTPLIQETCNLLAERFATVATKAEFLEIKHEFLIEILKKEGLEIMEDDLFQHVIAWSTAMSQKKNVSIQSILYEKTYSKSIMDYIRIEYLSKEAFKWAKRYLLEGDLNRWINWNVFSMANDVPPPRCRLCVSIIHEGHVKVHWSVSASDVKKLTKTSLNSRKIGDSTVFKIGDNSYSAVLYNKEGLLRLGVCRKENKLFELYIYKNETKSRAVTTFTATLNDEKYPAGKSGVVEIDQHQVGNFVTFIFEVNENMQPLTPR